MCAVPVSRSPGPSPLRAKAGVPSYPRESRRTLARAETHQQRVEGGLTQKRDVPGPKRQNRLLSAALAVLMWDSERRTERSIGDSAFPFGGRGPRRGARVQVS